MADDVQQVMSVVSCKIVSELFYAAFYSLERMTVSFSVPVFFYIAF